MPHRSEFTSSPASWQYPFTSPIWPTVQQKKPLYSPCVVVFHSTQLSSAQVGDLEKTLKQAISSIPTRRDRPLAPRTRTVRYGEGIERGESGPPVGLPGGQQRGSTPVAVWTKLRGQQAPLPPRVEPAGQLLLTTWAAHPPEVASRLNSPGATTEAIFNAWMPLAAKRSSPRKEGIAIMVIVGLVGLVGLVDERLVGKIRFVCRMLLLLWSRCRMWQIADLL